MKKITGILVSLILFLVFAFPIKAGEFHGILNPNGIPLYVIITVDWDGTGNLANWTVWGPTWSPVANEGTPLTSCTDCLAADYDFIFRGNTVQFDEVFVDTVTATPQVRHIVLHDKDGDGTYTGSESAEHYFPWRSELDGTWPILYFDRLDYTVTFDEDGNVEDFHYVQYEHKKSPAIE